MFYFHLTRSKSHGDDAERRPSVRRGTLFGQIKCHIIRDRYMYSHTSHQEQRRRVYFEDFRDVAVRTKISNRFRASSKTLSMTLSLDNQEDTCV